MARPFNYPNWEINTNAGPFPTPLTAGTPFIRHYWLGGVEINLIQGTQ